jgi:hypothetical protein
VAEGSVGAAKDANSKQKAIIRDMLSPDIGKSHNEIKKNPIRIKEKAPIDSKKANLKYF